MCYEFAITDPGQADYDMPHAQGERALHVLKTRERVSEHKTVTHELGLTTAELTALRDAITARLADWHEPALLPRFTTGCVYQYRSPRTGELALWPYLRVVNGWQPLESFLDGGIIHDDNDFVTDEWLDCLVKVGSDGATAA
jgi:hypothetical protein